MQAIKCSTCRKLVFMYDGDVRVKITAAKVTYPDGSKPPPGRFVRRPCGCDTKIYGRADNSIYIDGDIETPKVPDRRDCACGCYSGGCDRSDGGCRCTKAECTHCF